MSERGAAPPRLSNSTALDRMPTRMTYSAMEVTVQLLTS